MEHRLIALRRLTPRILLLGGVLVVTYILFFQAVDVIPHRVSKGTVLVQALGTGSIEGRHTINVSFEVTARLVQIHVDQGDRVVQGQELASIDDSSFQADIALAEQELVLASSTRRRLDAEIVRAQAVLAGAQDGLQRIRPLANSGAMSAEALVAAEERYNVAAAELTRSQSARSEGKEAALAAQKRLDRAKTALSQTMVRSPFDAVVTRKVREVGDVAVPGAAVLEIVATDNVWASVWVDESYISALTIGAPAIVVLRSDLQQIFHGKVERIGHEVDRETRELLVDVSMDPVPEKLVFGQRVDLWIELVRRADVVRVPSEILLRVKGQEGVFVAKGSRAKFQPLELGSRGRKMAEVIRGLSSGDIVLGPHLTKKKSLRDGQRIRLLNFPKQETVP